MLTGKEVHDLAGDREREYIFEYVHTAPLEREDARQKLLSLFEAYCIHNKIKYGTPLCELVAVSIFNNLHYETKAWHGYHEFIDFLGSRMKNWSKMQ